jgi:Asp-tRNA(Asn)/Glu-tRNA(Gln) amidotransferase A subunit family amidase
MPPSPLQQLQQSLREATTTPQQIAANSLAHSNTNANHNVYLAQSPADLLAQATTLEALDPAERPALYSIPISLKDCFDLRGYITTCGSRFYADHTPPATQDSWVAAQLKKAGALITGKTHLHQLAYGITGENPDFGDSLQPIDPTRLTGGSSSGAVASVQEGSALAAIGTDTGGSIRVPAALGGLAGFRASIDLASQIPDHPEIWAGGTHLAPSFDTLGILFRDLRDGPALAAAIFSLAPPTHAIHSPRIAIVTESFLHDAEPEVLAAYTTQQQTLRDTVATFQTIDTAFWSEALDILAPIQAHEAAIIQRANLAAIARANPHLPPPDFSVFEPAIAQRLAWGESITSTELTALRQRHATFRARMDDILTQHDLLMLPCAPFRQLRANTDHTQTRPKLLRYTAPISLSATPTITIPHPHGAGMQLTAPRGHDAALLAYAATLK